MDLSGALDEHALLEVGSTWRREGDEFMTSDVHPVAGSLALRDAEDLRSPSPLAPAYVASARMMAAYDAARALGILWNQGEVHHVADYALIRVIFEGAGSAWWVTSAPTREERIKRSFRIVLDELDQADSREAKSIPQLRTAASRQTRQQALDRIRELTKQLRAEMDAAGIPAAASAKIIMPKILNSAGRATTDGVEYGFSTAWSMTSSVAHGALTSVLQLSDRTQRSDMIMSNPDSVLAFTDPAGALLTLARQSWHRYARATA